ncbi:MAG TPA: prepilin-type N-terminal cleavage/methylation domain-containing protein [Candidatus Desulfobacillus sp.]|nr:prepilin-type N-terminal cleavage/methylation domain-containing protein [Candidatus Desulfobacillus sp.]
MKNSEQENTVKKTQKGFTLVEIAIVLVIIGLLLGGVLKGQELINSAKVKNLANDFRNISTFVYAYQDKYRALPGDDQAADKHLGATASNASSPAGTLGNGRINGDWNSKTKTDESVLFWQHVRLAGLATGTPVVGDLTLADEYVPKNSDGGRIGVTGDAVFTGTPAWVSNIFICSSNIQGRFARQLDTTVDDGNTTTGTMRVLCVNECEKSGAFVEVKPEDDSKVYTVCVSN